MNLLLISNSTNAGEAYLEYPKQQIESFLKKHNVSKVLFIPFAAVTFSYDDYEAKVQQRFDEFNVKVDSIHKYKDAIKAVEDAETIVVGGGNTFHLLRSIQELGLIEPIRKKITNGTPYIGWSAGSNLACPTICTTNDMPIVEPLSFEAFDFIPFQINPHYLDAHPEGHAGETREQRIQEYIAANPKRYVAGLREGCMFLVENGTIELIGKLSLRVFIHGQDAVELYAVDDLSFLLKR